MSARFAENQAGVTGTITIDLGRIAANWRALAAKVSPAGCGAVVKADAYGLGAERVIPALARAGCGAFFIATPEEAEQARRLAPSAAIYALDGVVGAADLFARLQIWPVLSTMADVEAWALQSKALSRKLPAGLHIDTGLNRLGLPLRATRRLAEEPAILSTIDLTLVMSHLASADNPHDPKNRDQLLAFETLSMLFPNTPRSLAASDGLMLGADYWFDLVRPGYALYGGQASETASAPVMPVVTVRARILSVADVAPGESVGYSATWRAKRPSRVATIAAGYADGVPRSASGADGRSGGCVLIGKHVAPIAGRVSMDLITVDVTDIAPNECLPGAFVTLIGDAVSLEDAGRAAGTIGYEMLTRLGRRFQRVYVGDAH